MGRACSINGIDKKLYKFLIENLEGKRPFASSRHRWEYNTDMDVQETGCEVVDWIQLSQGRDQGHTLVNTS
jgi:hypothetical protein